MGGRDKKEITKKQVVTENDCSEKDSEYNNSLAKDIVSELLYLVRSSIEKRNKKICKVAVGIFIVVFITAILLFLQAVWYKDIMHIVEISGVPVAVLNALLWLYTDKIKEKIKNGLWVVSVAKKIGAFVLAAAILSTSSWLNPNVKAFVTDVSLSIVSTIKEKIEDNSESGTEEIVEQSDNKTENSIKEETQYDYVTKFIINKVNKSTEVCNDLFEEACFFINEQVDAEGILNYFKNAYGQKIFFKKYKSLGEIQLKENDFINAKNKAENYKKEKGTNDEWVEMLPHENELLDIIRRQKEHAASYPDYNVYLKLSNNYQCLGDEYLRQKASTMTAKCYYYNSLLCDYECIKYAESEAQLNASLNRIYYRFNDIVSCCETTDEEAYKANLVRAALKDYAKPSF